MRGVTKGRARDQGRERNRAQLLQGTFAYTCVYIYISAVVKGVGTTGTRRRRTTHVYRRRLLWRPWGQFGVAVVIVVVGILTPDNFIKRFPLPHVARSRHDAGTPVIGPGARRVGCYTATAKITPGDGTTHARPEHASHTRACPSEPLDDDWPKKPHIKKMKSIIE